MNFEITEEMKADAKRQITEDMRLHGWGPHWLSHAGLDIMLKRANKGTWCGYVRIAGDLCSLIGCTNLTDLLYLCDAGPCFRPGVKISYARTFLPNELERSCDPHVNRSGCIDSSVGFTTLDWVSICPGMTTMNSDTEGKDTCVYVGNPGWLKADATYKDYDYTLEKTKRLAEAIVDYAKRLSDGTCPIPEERGVITRDCPCPHDD